MFIKKEFEAYLWMCAAMRETMREDYLWKQQYTLSLGGVIPLTWDLGEIKEAKEKANWTLTLFFPSSDLTMLWPDTSHSIFPPIFN